MEDQPADLTISVQLNARDAHWATISYLLNLPFLAIIAVIVCGSVYEVSLGDTRQAYIAAFVVFFAFVVLPWIQAALSMRNPMMRSPIYHTFSASGISSRFQGGNIGLDWQLVRSARESGRYISIRGKRGGPMLIPKRQLGEVELVSLRGILQRHLLTRAKLKAPN